MSRVFRWVLILGEGAAAGLFIGGVLGGWEVFKNEDLANGMPRLLAHHLAPPMLACGAFGLVLSGALSLIMGWVARWSRGAVVLCVLGLGLLWVGGMGAIAFPLRDSVFPLHLYGPKYLTALCIGLVALTSFLLLTRRSLEAWRCVRAIRPQEGASSVLPVIRRLHLLGAGTAVGVTALGLTYGALRPAGAADRGRPSIILISIDTLRADRLGVLGNQRSLTPALDRFAAEGMLFQEAISAAPWTLPSHAAIFTSLLPFDMRRHWDFDGVQPQNVLLAERLYEAGYSTAAFTGGGYVSAQFGFEQGFEIYEDHDEAAEGGPDAIIASALAWVRSVRETPFFLFLHTYEAHYPYLHAEHARPSDAGRLEQTITDEEVDAIHHGDLILTPDERRYVSDLYDGDVAWADRAIGGFLDSLRQEGTLDRTLVVVLSDHGEELWDREPDYSPDHGHSLYQELVHVPLLVRWPGQVPTGARVKTPVSLLDVTPTLLDLAGVPGDPEHRGRSLATTLKTGEEPGARTIQAESVQYGPDRFLMRNGDLTVILTPYPDRLDNAVPIPARPLEIFDLAADPLEQQDLSSHLTPAAAQMVDALWQRSKGVLDQPYRKGQEKPPELPDDLLQQLRSLGYLH